MKHLRARGPLMIGYASVALLVGGLAAWGVGTEIAGAVVATGTVRVESERQVLQHPDGGVVGAILARDGEKVAAGDVLLRLDDTFILSELAIVERQLLELHARKARLAAERDEAQTLVISAPSSASQLDPTWVAEQFAGQENLFAARLKSLGQEPVSYTHLTLPTILLV